LSNGTPRGLIGYVRIYPCVPELDALWDLIHEFGHTFQDKPPSDYCPGHPIFLVRENEAWGLGWANVQTQFDHLTKHESSYLARREICMDNNRKTKYRRL
jgi:hypothetical protein